MKIKKEEHLYQVQKILDKRITCFNLLLEQGTEYLVKWEGYQLKHSTWEPIVNLQNVLYMIAKYQKQHSKPQPIQSIIEVIQTKKIEPKKRGRRGRKKTILTEEQHPTDTGEQPKSICQLIVEILKIVVDEQQLYYKAVINKQKVLMQARHVRQKYPNQLINFLEKQVIKQSKK